MVIHLHPIELQLQQQLSQSQLVLEVVLDLKPMDQIQFSQQLHLQEVDQHKVVDLKMVVLEVLGVVVLVVFQVHLLVQVEQEIHLP